MQGKQRALTFVYPPHTMSLHLWATGTGLMQCLLIVLTVVLFFSMPVSAKQQVATAVVKGKVVVLYDDGTWQFRDDSAVGDCSFIRAGVEFCDPDRNWRRLSSVASTEVAAQFRYDEKNYGLFIVELLGTADQITLEYMRSAVIENFASVSGVNANQVVIHDIKEHNLNDTLAETLIYSGKFNNLPVIYLNTIVVFENLTVQIATFSLRNSLLPKHRDLHKEFLQKTQFKR